MALAPTPRSQDGFALIEVIVSAAVLALVALAVLSGMDASAGSSAREKARAIASSLAEQDQERMRGMNVDQLLKVSLFNSGKQTLAVDGVNYTVASKAEWITDDKGGTPSCGNSSNRSEYMHITTTVTSAIVGSTAKSARWTVPAVKVDSLVAPSVAYSQTHGSLGVRIVDRNDVGVPNIAVAGTGASALTTQNTDQNGCVIWRSIPIGTYTVSLNRAGWGTTDGKPMPPTLTRQQTVSPNTVSFVNLKLDQMLSATVNVTTQLPGQTTSGTKQASSARTISDISALSGDGIKRMWTGGSSTVTASNLFPFPKTSYTFFTGACDYESPFQLSTTYSNPNAVLLADPTKTLTATVYQPPVNMQITRAGSTNSQPANGQVKAYFTPIVPNSSDCADETKYVYTTAVWSAAPGGNTAGWVSQTSASFDPGLPFGTYSVCLLDTNTNLVYKPGNYDNTGVYGKPSATVYSNYNIKNKTTYWVSGTC